MTAPILPAASTDGQNTVVLGVDTHRDMHVVAVTTALGALLATSSFPTTAAGYRRLLDWARSFGVIERAGVEGTGSYGAALSRFLRGQGVVVVEVNRPDRAQRRRRGKNDTVDAQAAAEAVISGRATAVPKSGDGAVEQIRVYKIAKGSAVKARRQAINQIRSILVNADPQLREAMAGLGRTALVTRCAALATHPGPTAVTHSLSVLGRRVKSLDQEIADLLARINDLVCATAPALLKEYGVGTDSAAALLITAGDNPERFEREASFAGLCGASPVEMSSGKTTRHRLNRGGDRQANAALFRIVMTRLRDEPRTRAYLARRTTEGRTKREVIRCLKRYLARHLFEIIRTAMTPPVITTGQT
jgi:transposase